MFANSEINYHSDDETLVHHCLAGDENATADSRGDAERR